MRDILYIDGGCTGNSTKDMTLRRMIAVVSNAEGQVLSETKHAGGSNNIAELIAVRDALQWCLANEVRAVELRTDSRNNLSWVYGKTVGKKLNDRARVLELREEIGRLSTGLEFDLVWVPREENRAGHYIEATYSL